MKWKRSRKAQQESKNKNGDNHNNAEDKSTRDRDRDRDRSSNNQNQSTSMRNNSTNEKVMTNLSNFHFVPKNTDAHMNHQQHTILPQSSPSSNQRLQMTNKETMPNRIEEGYVSNLINTEDMIWRVV